MLIRQVLRGKGDDVVTICPDSSVRDLIELLAEHNIGAVVVSEDSRAVMGIVSERDVVRRLVTTTDVLDEPVSSIMTKKVHTCSTDDDVNSLQQLMTEHRVRHVPVVVDGVLRGIVSIGDIVKSRLGELQFERDQLESYVAGTQ